MVHTESVSDVFNQGRGVMVPDRTSRRASGLAVFSLFSLVVLPGVCSYACDSVGVSGQEFTRGTVTDFEGANSATACGIC